MKVLASDKFRRSVPKEKRENVIKTIEKLKKELKRLDDANKGIRDITNGFSIWKIKNAKEDIYKLRVDQSNRIIFTLTKCFGDRWNKDEFEDENNIHLLRYCTHDEQILKAKNLNLEGYIDLEEMDLPKEVEQELYDLEDENYNTFYDPSKDKISIYSDEDLEKIFGSNSREDIYKLNERQKEVLRAECPIFLFGSAGSGKTTIAVRKIKNICDSNRKMRIGYFTFSPKLKDDSKEIFKSLEKYNKNKEKANIEFYSIEEYLKKISRREFDIKILDKNIESKNGKHKRSNPKENIHHVCKYKDFETWIYDNNIKIQMDMEDYDLFELYREIRGIIKGMIGIDWCLNDSNLYKRVLMDRDEYLNLKPEYSSYRNKEKAYEVARRYQNWLNDNEEFCDDNDLAVEAIEGIENGEIEKFDFVVVDEIQDLTEKQIYMIYNLVKKPENVFFAGDYHQTINATYFNTHRIKTLFTVNEEDFSEYNLDINYRSHKEIVELSKRVSELRIEKLYQDRKNDYTETYLDSEDDKNYRPILLKKNEENKKKMLEVVNDRHYASVIVPDEIEKERLIAENNKGLDDTKIMTVSEIKGIEKEVVICYNMISRNKDIWEKIMEIKNEREGFEKQFLYRPYFNKLYVAITRARKQVCFYEEEDNEILKLLSDEGRIEILNEFNEGRFNLNVLSTSDDFIKSGLEYEEQGEKENYVRAIKEYEKSTAINKDLYIRRCKAAILEENMKIKESINEFESVGNEFFRQGMFKDALKCYEKSGNIKAKIKCLVAQKDKYELEEILTKSKDLDIFDAVFDLDGIDKSSNEKVILSFLEMCNEDIEEKTFEKMETLERISNLF